VVSLGRRTERVEARDLQAPLSAFRAAVAALPEHEDPLADRLFALECLAKAGRNARAERDQLAPARRAAEDYIDTTWDPDVPHAAVLGQALSTINALDDDPPQSWPGLLDETLATLEKRQARLGVATTPFVLASVIRGVTSASHSIPSWLLDSVRAYYEANPKAVEMAELAEATSRDRSGDALTRQAIESIFSDRRKDDPDVAIARAWLTERLKATVEEIVSDEKIALARMQALTSQVPSDRRAVAMLAEVAGRSSENLILLSETELERLRARSRGRALVENYVWRTLALVVPALLALVYLKSVLGWFDNHNPADKTLAGWATLLTLWIGFAIVSAWWMAMKRFGRDPGYVGVVAGLLFAVAPAVVVFFLYPTS
jgi:hypothetical protein